MLILVSGATRTLKAINDDRFGVLVVPGAGNDPQKLPLRPNRWAMDNGAFSGLDVAAFVGMLQRYQDIPGCRWVAAPDVVGDAAATLAQWPFWSQLIRGVGFRPALVAQDGLTIATTPWREVACLFIGGTTLFKWGRESRTLLAYAQAMGMDTHIGRVNTRGWYREAERRGAASIDGTSRSMFPKTQMAKDQRWMDEWARQPEFSL